MNPHRPAHMPEDVAQFQELSQPALLVEGDRIVAITPEAGPILGWNHLDFDEQPLAAALGRRTAEKIIHAHRSIPTAFSLEIEHPAGTVRQALATRIGTGRPNAFIVLMALRHRSLLDIISAEYRGLLDTVPDVILVHDHLGTIVFANQTAAQILGRPVERIEGTNVMDLLSDEESVAATQRGKARQVDGEEKFFGYQLRRETPEGEQIELDVRSMPFFQEGPRQLILLVGKNTGQDVVRQERLETARLRAEADSASKSAALAQTSHEIRTPLNIVFGMIDMALDQDIPEAAEQYLTMARSAARTLLSLLDDFLEFSKLDAGKLSLRESFFSPREILEEACAGLALLAQEKDLRFHLMLDPKLPDQLFGDSGRLRQIVGNLTTNAIKYTDKGDIRVKADVASIEETSCNLHLRIADTGCGISPQALPYVFQPFHQIDEDSDGSGLGLAIVKQLVELLGGRVWVESVEGRGSEFHFTAEFRFAKPTKAPAPLAS